MATASNDAELREMLSGGVQKAVNIVIDKMIDENTTILDSLMDGDFSLGLFAIAWTPNNASGGGDLANGGFDYDSSKITYRSFPYNAGYGEQNIVESLPTFLYEGHKGIWTVGARNGEKELIKRFNRTRFKSEFGAALASAGVPAVASNGGVTITTT